MLKINKTRQTTNLKTDAQLMPGQGIIKNYIFKEIV